jgi:hypothetical protein
MRGFEPLPAAQLPAVPSYSPSPQSPPAPGPAGVQAEIVIPVRNEERDLAPSVRRIHEVPVDWIDDADSRVTVIPTAVADLRGIARLSTGLARGRITVPVLGDPSPRGLRPRRGQSPARSGSLAGQLARFVAVGVTCTVAYILIYLMLRGAVGAQAANPLSLLITAVANTALNRRLTFGIRGRAHAARHQLRGRRAGRPGARGRRLRQWRFLRRGPDRRLGRGSLHPADRGRHDRLQPHRPELGVVMTSPCLSRQCYYLRT